MATPDHQRRESVRQPVGEPGVPQERLVVAVEVAGRDRGDDCGYGPTLVALMAGSALAVLAVHFADRPAIGTPSLTLAGEDEGQR